MTVADTAAVNYGLSLASPQIALDYKVNYTPWTGSADERAKVTADVARRITGNHTRFGKNVDALVGPRQAEVAAGGNRYAFIDDLGIYLLKVPEVSDLVDIYDRFAPVEVFAPGDAAVFSALHFADDLMSCPDLSAGEGAIFEREGSCAWGRMGGSALRRDGGAGSVAYDENVFQLAAGLQTEVAPDWFLGAAVGYENADLSGSGVSGDGDRWQAGAVVKRVIGPTTLSASLSGGIGDYSLTRQVLTPEGERAARGKPDLSWASAHLRAARQIDLGADSYLKPWLDFGVLHQHQDGYTETGAGDYGLRVDGFDETYATLNPMLEFGSSFEARGMAAEAVLAGGALAFLGGTDRATTVQFAGIDGAVPGVTVRDGMQDVFGVLNGAIKLRIGARTSLEASATALLSGDQQQYSGGLRFNVAF